MSPNLFTSRVSRFALAVAFLMAAQSATQAAVIPGMVGTITNGIAVSPNHGVASEGGQVAWTGANTPNFAAQVQLFNASSGGTATETTTLDNGGAFTWSGIYQNTDSSGNPTGPPIAFGPPSGVGTLAPPLLAYCLELNQTLNTSPAQNSFQVTTDIAATPVGTGIPSIGGVPGMGTVAAGYMSDLWALHFNTLPGGAETNARDSGAFQLAIWKLEYDVLGGVAGGTGTKNGIQYTAGVITGIDWTTGFVRATNEGSQDELGIASAYLIGLISNINADPLLRAMVSSSFDPNLNNGSAQDQLFQTTPGGVGHPNTPPVPEPASMVCWLLMGTVAGGLRFARRRRRAAAQ